MTTVFVYEYCCAVGLGRGESDPAHSLYREGRAMRDAVAADFRRLPGMEVVILDGVGHQSEWEGFTRRVESAGICILIAPETNNCLWTRVGYATDQSKFVLNCTTDAIEWCGFKSDTAYRWRSAGVPTPNTWALEEWPAQQFPAVAKPDDGVGSEEVWYIRDAIQGENLRRGTFYYFQSQSLIVQDFVSGRPASIAFLVGPRETVPLVPTFQVLSDDGRFRYLGGELPIRPDLAERAVALGRRAIDCVPGLRGYVGVDLILGDAVDGSRDYAIEINPRLTTSYVGLRHLADFNLAGAMLAVATGEPAGELRWKPGRVRFHPDGKTESDPTPGATFG